MCEYVQCSNKIYNYAPCCHVPLCEKHYSVWECCVGGCDEVMCKECLKDGFKCKRCRKVYCCEHNTSPFVCNCEKIK